jgi:translocation and assembly module TamB
MKREFSVQEGSTLQWTGDILGAQADLTAVYEIETSPLELMQNQVTDNAQMNIYKQKLPFLVNLHMEGELLSPEISFTLDMEDEAKGYASGSVYGKIQAINQEESQVNKQVFSLLILQRFIAENPFASSSGSTEGKVRSSVSKILSDQLEKLTDQIEGIDIDVGLKSYEDYSTGEQQGRTDLNLGVSKQFLDDRITVKVAGNVNLEGGEQQRNLTDIAGDVSLEYKLTEDGRFRLVTFRKEVYEELLQGEVIETGAGFIIVKDYDKFREIFRKNKEENWHNEDEDDDQSEK